MFSSVGHAFSGAAGAASGAASDRSAPGGHSLFSNLGLTHVGRNSSHNFWLGKTSITEQKDIGGKLTKVTSSVMDGMTTQIYESEGVGTFKMQNGRFTAGSLDNFQVSTLRQKAFSHLGSIVSANMTRHDNKDGYGLDDKLAKEIRETSKHEFSNQYTSEEQFVNSTKISKEVSREVYLGLSTGGPIQFSAGGGMTWKDSAGQEHSIKLDQKDMEIVKNVVDSITTRAISGSSSLQSALTKADSVEIRTAANDAISVSSNFNRGDWSAFGNKKLDQGYTPDQAVAEMYRIGDLSLVNPDLAYKEVINTIGDTTRSFKDENSIDVEKEERKMAEDHNADVIKIGKKVGDKKGNLNPPSVVSPTGANPESEVEKAVREAKENTSEYWRALQRELVDAKAAHSIAKRRANSPNATQEVKDKYVDADVRLVNAKQALGSWEIKYGTKKRQK
jgi:hypothetical protein